jgi:hypothetical protein
MADTEQSAASPARPTFFARNAPGLVREIRAHPESVDADIGRHREELPIDLAAGLHIKGPDVVAFAYRRLLAELGFDADAAAGPADAPPAGQSR